MRGCAGLKLSGACARDAGGAMARGWSVPQSRPRVAVPTGLFPSYRRTCGSRLESVFGCFAVRSLVYSLLPNVSGHRRRLVRRTVERLVQPNHFAWPRCLSPENWCFCVENNVFFGFWGYFGVFLAILGRKTDTFSHFLA